MTSEQRVLAARARLSPLVWLKMVSPATVPARYADFHPALTRLPKPGEHQARIVFRGAAKTTLTRATVLHAIRYQLTQGVVLVRATGTDCKNDAVALAALAPLAGMTVETRLADQVTLINGCPVWLKSPKGRVRGLNWTYSDGTTIRPDLVICDDLEDEESARSTLQTGYLEQFVFSSLIPVGGQNKPVGLILLGTPIGPQTMIAKAMRQEGPFKNWTTPLVVPIIDPDGVPAWPDLYDERLQSQTTDDSWATEYLLQPLPAGSLLFPPARTRWCTVAPTRQHPVWVGVDPAGDGADATGIVAVTLHQHTIHVVDAHAYTGVSENMPAAVGMFVRSLQAKGWKVAGINVEQTGMSTFATPLIRADVAPVPVVTESPLKSKIERAMPLTLWHRVNALTISDHLHGSVLDSELHTWQRVTGATVTGHDDMPDALTWAAGLATRAWTVQPPSM
jgi:hypothetical protein